MDIHDKELWLIRHGSIDTYGSMGGFKPCMVWTSWGRLHTTKVQGKDDDAIHRLYDTVKDSLYSIAEHIK